MSSYVDTKLINCNRLASVESKAGNDTNPAVFTNPLHQTVKLDVGDKVSLERAFISEVGAGNPSTIEFKGRTTGKNTIATYTKVEQKDFYYKKSKTYDPKYRLGYFRTTTTTEVSDDFVDLRDNLAPLIIGYYITSNEYPNYIQQPRKFPHLDSRRGTAPRMDEDNHYTRADSEQDGMTKFDVSPDCFCRADWITRIGKNDDIIKQKIDCKRYTLFVKDRISYSIGDSEGNDVKQFPSRKNGIISEATYFRFREKINIEIKQGFNTPSAVADQITQQLKETKNENTFEILDTEGYTRPITRTIETNTYKPINAQNIFNYNLQTSIGYGGQQAFPVTDANINQLAVDYIATFGYIGVKRPEIFEEGRNMMNQLVPNTPAIRDPAGNIIYNTLTNGFEGFQLTEQITKSGTTNKPASVITNILYTRENCEKILKFFDTQALYPELWNDLEQNNNYQDANLINGILPSPDNSRFIHMNKYADNLNDSFGDDGFVIETTFSRASVPLFMKFNNDERDNFIEGRNYIDVATNGLMLGFCFPRHRAQYASDGTKLDDIYLIAFDFAELGGVPLNLFTDDGDTKIFTGRKLGYDFHSTAYSTAIITPYSGYDIVDIGTKAAQNDGSKAGDAIHSFTDTIQHIFPLGNTTTTVDLTAYQTQTYIGANNPLVSHNGVSNRFEFSKLHTSNNLGNKFKAGRKVASLTSESMTPAANPELRTLVPPDANLDAGNTVYKINPRPSQFGFSPNFKPYTRDDFEFTQQCYPKTASEYKSNNATDGTNTQAFNAWNDNIAPFTVFDSHGGIYIDNWGYDEKDWEDNLWDILGFSYDAVVAPPSKLNVLTRRVDNENSDKLYRPTTNAEVVTTDTKSYITNYQEAGQFSTTLPYPVGLVNYKAIHDGSNDVWLYGGSANGLATEFTPVKAQPRTIFNQVNQITTSTSITATDLKKSVLRPYYTIRSNILEGSSAIGGNPTGADLPIISIVDKYSAANDYFMGNPSDIQFTVTKPTMISDITTSIHDSDGVYANVDKTSAVIYKIQKVKKTPIGLIQQIMEDAEKESKKNKK